MEHGRDGQHDIALTDGHPIHHRRGEGVQNQSAMGIEHPLGISGGPGGKTHRSRIVLIERGVGEVPSPRREQLLVAVHPRRSGLAAERCDDDSLELDVIFDLLVCRQEHIVDNEEAIAGVVRNEGDLVRMEAEIERVEHATGRRDAEIAFQMTGVVPHERCHTVAGTQPGAEQGVRELSRAAMEIRVAVALDLAAGVAGNDLGLAEERARAIEDRIEREREIHHPAAHRRPRKGSKGRDGSASRPSPPPQPATVSDRRPGGTTM